MKLATGKEVLELLRTKLEIPENVYSLDLSLAFDDIPRMTVTYYPKLKEEPK